MRFRFISSEGHKTDKGEREMRTLVVALLIVLPPAAAYGQVIPPPVPPPLEVPAGNVAFRIDHASGTQAYICLPSGSRLPNDGVPTYIWTFFGPQATLFDDAGEQVATLFLSPNPVDPIENGTPRATWQDSRDTSRVWAGPINAYFDEDYVERGAIPWLLLRVVGRQSGTGGSDTLTTTSFLHRVNTSGGVAPKNQCSNAGDVGSWILVPYTADYVYYRRQ
jgi:Protein of unknown function (DUF3455)